MPQWSASRALEDALWGAARKHLSAGVLAHRLLVPAVIARSEMYTTGRDQLGDAPRGAAKAADLAARALFFGTADAAKITIPLGELAGRGLIADRRPLRIADVGAGAGAMTLGALDFLGERPTEILAIDRDGDALDVMRDAVSLLSPTARIVCERGDLANVALERGRFDLVIAGTVLNELDPGARQKLVQTMIAGLADDGAAIIIEPALREAARALHELRDWALRDQIAHVFAPCTRRSAPCPMLADERDWCHEDRPTQLPPRASRIAQVTGLRTHGLKFSYLVLRKSAEPLIDAERPALRIVSAAQRSRGKRECFACGDAGRVQLRLFKKNRTDANRIFERAQRGDVAITSADGTIARDEHVELVQPAGAAAAEKTGQD